MNIQELKNKYKELGAEIERLKQQPEGVWKPEAGGTFWVVDGTGGTACRCNTSLSAEKHNNVYKTAELADKASVRQRRSNLVIQACLNFDPDFVLDWADKHQEKFGFFYDYNNGDWDTYEAWAVDRSAAHVSTREIAEKVVAYLNSQEIK
tara:strand:+ start:340 stop:789 length:450 start_codon:yes stop_codon:yes gene_type:complete